MGDLSENNDIVNGEIHFGTFLISTKACPYIRQLYTLMILTDASISTVNYRGVTTSRARVFVTQVTDFHPLHRPFLLTHCGQSR